MINRFLRRLTVRGRILGGFLVLLFLLILTAPLILTDHLTLTNRLQEITEVEARADRLLLLVSARVLSARVNLMRYVGDVTPSTSEALADVDEAVQFLTEAQALIASEEQSVAVASVLEGLSQYRTLIGDVQTARTEGRVQDIATIQFEAFRIAFGIGQQIEQIVNQSAARVAAANQAVFAEAQRRLIYLLAGYVVSLILALLIAAAIQRSITRPIAELREGAEAFRQGEMDTVVPVAGSDELSLLAQTFNQLTDQLSESYRELEQRVADRTQDLERRALQLQVAAEVARGAATVTDLDSLLNRAVNLIRDRYNFYHVAIALIDDLGRDIVLRAGSGEVGRILVQRGLKLRVGEVGIVGHVAGTGEPRVVNDVEADFAYQKEPLLPDTRSEMALPLRIGPRVIGVLDVQSTQRNAFTPDDVVVLQTIADQLAVAIQNARLLDELQERLKEINTLYQRYAQESWAQTGISERPTGYQYDLSSVIPIERSLPPDILARLQIGRAVTVGPAEAGVTDETSTLVVPLMMYDRMIGVIGLEEDDPDHHWSADDIAMVEAIASQVALALDNARLLEESQLRADQIRILQEITATAASQVNLTELLENVSQKLIAGFDLSHCTATLIDPSGENLTIVTDVSVHPSTPGSGIVGTKIPLDGNELTQQVLRTRQTVVVYDAQNDPLTVHTHDLLKERGTNTLLVMPLFSREVVIGTIGLNIADLERRFSGDDLQLLDQVGLQISSAVEVARSFEQTERRAARERLVGEVASRIRETLDIDTVLRTAVGEINRALALDEVAFVWEVAEDTPTPYIEKINHHRNERSVDDE